MGVALFGVTRFDGLTHKNVNFAFFSLTEGKFVKISLLYQKLDIFANLDIIPLISNPFINPTSFPQTSITTSHLLFGSWATFDAISSRTSLHLLRFLFEMLHLKEQIHIFSINFRYYSVDGNQN